MKTMFDSAIHILLTRTVSGSSPRQKSAAMTIAQPMAPLRTMVVMIARGTFQEAFSISSDIWQL